MNLGDPDRFASARNFAPFAAAAALAWLTVPIATSVNWLEYGAATALLPVCVALGAWLRTGIGRVAPSLVFLAALGLLRNSGGGIATGASAVAIVPVFYTALHGESRSELYVLLAGLTVFYLVPILLVGPPAYPHTQYRAATLAVAASSIIGLATQRLVAATRERTAEARERGRMLEELSVVVRGLFNSEDARVDVCAAARKIGHASAVALYEPTPGGDAMRATAQVGIEIDGDEPSTIEIPLERPTAVREVFESGRPVLVTEEVERHVGSFELWNAAGRPASVLYEPLLRQGETIGVLVVGWSGEVNADGARRQVVELLAHEAAAVLTRADALSKLSDQASTDPLTGLPNRRAWDASLAEALREVATTVTVAILDLDHFKQYNDTYGHPAGDRLLKESAAMWREQLRSGDLLARLGGEEFGLLLLNCDQSRAREVIERLRGSVYHDRTCSVGFAEHKPGETAEQVMARADTALYEAKETGRDRVCMSVGGA